jgi:CheY-like chemotaxis protein
MVNSNGMVENINDMSVLAVDDNSQARALIRETLKDLGIDQIFMAKDGREALDFLGNCDDMIHVIICDWNMPGMTGLEILRQVRTVDPDIPFMMLTGAVDMESVATAKNHGVTSYLAKPFSPAQLEKKLSQILRIVKLRQEPA